MLSSDRAPDTTIIVHKYGDVLTAKQVKELQKRMAQLEEENQILKSAAKSPKKDGKGNIYVDLIGVHIPIKEAAMTAARKEFVKIFA